MPESSRLQIGGGCHVWSWTRSRERDSGGLIWNGRQDLLRGAGWLAGWLARLALLGFTEMSGAK